jgi:integrase
VWEDVDFWCGVMTVCVAFAKTWESRSVPMNRDLTATLRVVRMTAVGNGPVFCTPQGASYQSFRTAFDRVIHKAGITGLTLHDLRHTFASRLVMQGIDLPTAQAFMGPR